MAFNRHRFRRICFRAGLSVLAVLTLTLAALWFFGFEPRERSPGFWLSGQIAREPVADWSFTERFPSIYVETRTWYGIPHSVTTTVTAHDGDLYLTSTYRNESPFPAGRVWNRHVARDPRVRLKIGEWIYEGSLERVTDPQEKKAVLESKAKKYPDLPAAPTERVQLFRFLPLRGEGSRGASDDRRPEHRPRAAGRPGAGTRPRSGSIGFSAPDLVKWRSTIRSAA